MQKRADEILAEVTMTLTLSGLRGEQGISLFARSGRCLRPQPNVVPGCSKSAFVRGAELDGRNAQNFTTGMVETFGVGVCRGRYSQVLQRAWHEWDALHGSENDSPDMFDADQLFVVRQRRCGAGCGWESC